MESIAVEAQVTCTRSHSWNGQKNPKVLFYVPVVCSIPALTYCDQVLLYLLVQRGFLKTFVEFFGGKKCPEIWKVQYYLNVVLVNSIWIYFKLLNKKELFTLSFCRKVVYSIRWFLNFSLSKLNYPVMNKWKKITLYNSIYFYHRGFTYF